MKSIISVIAFLVAFSTVFAQGNGTEFMRSNQKIYVVVAVLFVILLGLIGYLFSLEKRLKKLEK
ncbi:MAG: CcmD family protein [Chitinophagales bacterium]|nr:CcmD family protein [Chitinophagales bacterium]